MVAASATIFLAIQAGLRLYSASRKAYVDATRGRELNLPLPRTEGVGFDSAFVWFSANEIGQAVAGRHERIAFLLGLPDRTEAQKRELLSLYLAFHAELVDDPTGQAAGGASERELGALLTVRQWAEDEPGAPPSALQQIAGTVINIAVDYYAATPGAVSDKRPEGRALLAVLNAIDDVDFANTPVRDVAGDVLVGILDGVAANPELLSGGEKEQAFVENITRSLAESAKAHLANGDPTQDKLDAGAWLNLVARAVVQGGAETVLGNPARFLGADDGAESKLVQAVGGTLSNLLLGENKVTFRRLLSGQGLQTLARSALGAVAQNPQILKVGNKGLESILVALASDLAQREDLSGPDLFPDMARLVLQKTGENLDLVWGKRISDPKKHLLLTAVKSAMKELARKPPTGSTWRPSLTKQGFLSVAESVLDEVIDQPQWLLKRAGESSDTLGIAMRAILDSVRTMDEKRISAETGAVVLRAGLQAVALRVSLLDKVPAGAAAAGKRAITAAIDAILASVFGAGADADAQWRIARNSAIQVVIETALARVGEFGAGPAHIACITTVTDKLAQGEVTLADYDEVLRTCLAAA